MNRPETQRRRPLLVLLGALLVPYLGGCDSLDGDKAGDNGSPSGGSSSLGAGLGDAGEELEVGNGLTVFIDPNSGGNAAELQVTETFWGRLVDIYDRESGVETLRHRSYVIGDDINPSTALDTDGNSSTPPELLYSMETDPVTGGVKLTILAPKGSARYQQAFDRLHDGLTPVFSSMPGGLGPFSLVARNSVLVIHTNDLIDPATIVEGQSIRVRTGNPPSTPFSARVLPDPNYGQVFRDADSNGILEFRPTRLLVDFTISETELPQTSANAANNVGLPASPNQQQANVSVQLPTQVSSSGGVFTLMRNLSGQVFRPLPQGPQIDESLVSKPLVVGFRSGSPEDPSNGFMFDQVDPRIVAALNVGVSNVRCDDGGDCTFDPDFTYRLDLDYADATCEPLAPTEGDILEMPNGILAEVLNDPGVAVGGVFSNVRVRDITRSFSFVADTDNAEALLVTPYEPLDGDAAAASCFLAFSPQAGVLPNTEVSPNSLINLRFSEPMDPASLSALEDFLVLRTDGELAPEDIVVGTTIPSADLTRFSYKPVLPFSHIEGTAETYFVSIGQRAQGLTDLAGNRVADLLPDLLPFEIDPDASTDENAGFVLRFNAEDLNEDPPHPNECDGKEITGQFLFDQTLGVIRARPVTRYSMIVDRNQPTVNQTSGIPVDPQPFLFGIGATVYDTPTEEPMVGKVGSRTMTLWRYCDMGLSVNGLTPDGSAWSLTNSSYYNVDVEGISWAAVGSVNVDHFENFEIALAHSSRFPDESYIPLTLVFPPARNDLFLGGDTGMRTGTFRDNALPDGTGKPLKVVHRRDLGYTLNPLDKFVAPTGTEMMPYPLNQEGDPSTFTYYTWRDTAIQALGGEPGVGVNLVFAGTFDPFIGIGVPPQVLLNQIGDPSAPAVDWLTTHGVGPVAPAPPSAASFAWQGGIPSIAMPLLMDFRCFPDSGAGTNRPDVGMAGFPIVHGNINFPVDFRVTSTGGTDTNGVVQKVNPDPDLAEEPTGGYNRNSATAPTIPFGAPTLAGDSLFYMGQLDLVVRLSRVYTRWFDTRGGDVTFLPPVTFPSAENQPSGTSVRFAFRRAELVGEQNNCSNKQQINGLEYFRTPPGPSQSAEFLDAYGDQRALTTFSTLLPGPVLDNEDLVPYGDPLGRNSSVSFSGGDATWTSDLDDLEGAQLIQTRMTMISNPVSGVVPELSAVGWVFDFADPN